jgi:hypothetical protein
MFEADCGGVSKEEDGLCGEAAAIDFTGRWVAEERTF